MLVGQYRDAKGKWNNIPTTTIVSDETVISIAFGYCKQHGIATRVIDPEGKLDEKGVRTEKIVREFRNQRKNR